MLLGFIWESATSLCMDYRKTLTKTSDYKDLISHSTEARKN